jgi:glutaminyl-tRNA synthetase
MYKPVQWEFSRLNISGVALSKRKLTGLVESGKVRGWDDPRLYTVSGLRRRGFTAEAINKFVRSVGITFSESVIDIKLLEKFVRDDLFVKAKRIMCVLEPLRVKIYDGGVLKREIYIEKNDFRDKGNEDFKRLTRSQCVGLYNYCTIKVRSVINDSEITADVCMETPLKYIHWVDCSYTNVEIRMYNFPSSEEEPGLKTIGGMCENSIRGCKAGDKYQFQRIGYFCVDSDSKDGSIVVNQTLLLKNALFG